MAESILTIGVLASEANKSQDQEEGTVQFQIVDDQVDSGDCDEYSSGSDRSFEADDSAVDGNQEISDGIRSRRKRRHGSHGSRRHKGGIRHKHKGFNPYPPKEEIKLKRKSQELKEKENAAAVLRRDEGGQELVTFPVAPFNSTQYLMDEHSLGSPAGMHKTPSSSKLNPCSPSLLPSVTLTTKESISRKDKEFVDIYTTVHAEGLQSLPKEELVKHYMSLEEKVADLQKKVAEAQKQKLEESFVKVDRDVDKDSVLGSDTNSLSSTNEEFVDLSTVNPIPVSESQVLKVNCSQGLQDSERS